MQLTSALLILFLQLKLQSFDCFQRRSSRADLSLSELVTFASRRGSPSSPKLSSSRIDGRSIKDGSLIEYVSAKGTKRLAIVSKRKGESLEVLNNVMIEFLVPVSKVTHLINGFHTYDDLMDLTSTISMYNEDQVQKLWACAVEQTENVISMEFVSQNVFGASRPIDMYASMKLMKQFGKIFFGECAPSVANDDDKENSSHVEMRYKPLSAEVVAGNLKHQGALQVFRSEFTRMMTTQAPKSGEAHSATEMKKDVVHILNEYIEGLKQIVAKVHPWVVNGWSTNTIDARATVRGIELLEYLELSPTSKNARKVLEMSGVWNVHTNIEMYVMAIRDEFPAEVLEEAKNLLENMEDIPDLDASIRKDLRHLTCYAIDSEGAAEIDDAVSLERTPDGLEKVWIHISDVSRWVRPASALCTEAERRMTSAYFADGVISMFPPVLSERLLSLGARAESYALSCGVVLSDKGDIVSYEICPSLIRLSHRITYTELDAILKGQTPADTVSDVGSAEDLMKLNDWTRLRGAFRKDENFALDSYLMHKTDLSLSVDTTPGQGSEPKTVITTVLKHGDSLSVNLVAECMILMSESVGDLCGDIGASVTYKTQRPQSPFHASDLEALKGETPNMRSIRIVRYLKGAMDSKTKGLHCTSGAQAYVQCTSPIRRYYDLLNHYNLKAAMHAATVPRTWTGTVTGTAVKGAVEGTLPVAVRLQTLSAVKMASRSRYQYWLHAYLKQLAGATPRPSFLCTVMAPSKAKEKTEEGRGTSTSTSSPAKKAPTTRSGEELFFDAMVLDLGSFQTYRLYCPRDFNPVVGGEIRCQLHKFGDTGNIGDFVFLPAQLDVKTVPADLLKKWP